MDQRDDTGHRPIYFYFLVYEGHEVTPGYVCGVVCVEVDITPPAQALERITIEMVGRGWGMYRGIFHPRKENYPRITTEHYSGTDWVLARLLGFLHDSFPAAGPFQVVPCSVPPEFASIQPPRFGESRLVAVLPPPEKDPFERWIQRLASSIDEPITWHINAGRLIIETKGNVEKVLGAIRDNAWPLIEAIRTKNPRLSQNDVNMMLGLPLSTHVMD